ncbi:Glycosyltransferase buaB [Cladobotryum mycophilum]|uniref:Glycosyltransferase buaB n=1 Tax=Cladobotryum mycophilum TaxID=491253 RepID=A0ABR0T410_9HYPO
MPKKSVVFITTSANGQANVHIAAASSIILKERDIDVHFISFPSIQPDVQATTRLVTKLSPRTKTIQFHSLPGLSHTEAIIRAFPRQSQICHGWGFREAARWYKLLPDLILPWSVEEYILQFKTIVMEIEAIIATSNGKENVVCVVDSLFAAGIDAVKHLGTPMCLLSPNTLKELALDKQPNAAALWRYPVVGSGYPFPLPWYLVPFNFLLIIWLVYQISTSKAVKEKGAALGQHRPPLLENFMNAFSIDIPTLCQSLPETDFPYAFTPTNVTFCGPILRPSETLSDCDMDLKSWLDGKRTVLINLGGVVAFTHRNGSEIAEAIKILLRHSSNVQVLWKVKYGSYISQAETFYPQKTLAAELEAGSVRIVDWIPIEPSALMREANIVAAVNHGGASSWNEAIASGIPQVNLPLWADTYDFARRSEMLGVGIWGSKTSAPGYDAKELGQALIDVVEGETAALLTAKARQFMALISSKGEGRDIAATRILELLD